MKTPSGLLTAQAEGRHGDTILAHINPAEARMLKDAGGSGTTNPKTGLLEFSFWTSIRDTFESVASVVGNYFLPGSSIVTGQLVSKGSQEQLNSTVGKIANMASGVAGGAAGNMSNYGKLLNSVGLNAVSTGIDNVGTYLNKTLNTLTSAAGEAVGGAATSTATTAGTAAGNAAIEGGGETVAKVAAENMGAIAPSATELVTGGAKVAPAAAPSSQGMIGRALDWASKNPVPALMAGQTAMATIGGMGTAEAAREAAQLNRETQLALPGLNKTAGMTQGAWGGQPNITPADPQQALTVDGKYLYGPKAGQYAPGRGPGLLTSPR